MKQIITALVIFSAIDEEFNALQQEDMKKQKWLKKTIYN